MIISHERSFLFVHIPKCGGTAFRRLISDYHDHPTVFWDIQYTGFLDLPLDHAHLRTWELQMFYPAVFELLKVRRSLCFFRNPVERYVSAVYEHFRQFRPWVALPTLPWAEQQRIVGEFTALIDPRMSLADVSYVHFSQQTWFTHLNGERLVGTILPLLPGFDAFRAALMVLELPDSRDPDEAVRPGRDAVELLGPDMLARVRELYETDYAFCERTPHLAGLMSP